MTNISRDKFCVTLQIFFVDIIFKIIEKINLIFEQNSLLSNNIIPFKNESYTKISTVIGLINNYNYITIQI